MPVPPVRPGSLIPFIAACLLLSAVSADCGKGCLRCSPDGYCQQCDSSSFFVLQNSTCVLQPVVGCNATDLIGNCLVCNNNYFLYNSSCFPVSAPIANCVQYLSATACSSCGKGYLLSGGTCQTQKTIIQYCQTYTPDGSVCTACIANYVLSYDGLSCVAATVVPNCQSYTNLLCSQCSGTYINEPYAYSAYVGLVTNTSSIYQRYILLALAQIGKQNITASTFPTCLFLQVTNCKVPLDYSTCQVCNPNYYLDQNLQCQPYPTTAISFCSVYLNNVTCSLCLPGYYLSATGGCTEVTPIANCTTYSSTANNVCLQCAAAFYSTLTACVARTASVNITNCIATDPYNDKCLNCTALFTPSYDGASCVAAIPNCAAYTKTALSLTCSSCVQNYFLDQSGNCVLSNAQNCLVVSGLTTCTQCNPGYYLGTSNTCQNHTLSNLQSCNTTSITQLNGCTACDPTKILATIDGMCLPVGTTLSNCLIYQTPTTCLTCDATVSYRLNGICYSTYLPNCVLYASNLVTSCVQCVVDMNSNSIYIAYPSGASNNQCVPGNPNVAYNCQVPTNTNNVEGCARCAPSYYPITITSLNNAFCVPRNYYLLAGQSAVLVNCLLYNYQTQSCIVCAPGLVVDLSGSCVTQCSTGGFLYSSFFDTSNATDVSLTGRLKCSTAAPNYAAMNFNPSPFPCYFVTTSTSGSDSFCGACASTQIGVIDLSVSQSNTITASLWPIAGLFSVSYYNYVPSIQGCVSTQVTLTGSTSQVATLAVRSAASTPMTFDNCRFALKVGSKYGCGACKFGYSGPPVADFDNTGYFIQSCQAIPSCQPSIYYNGLGSLSGQITSTAPPIDYFVSCHYCQNGLIPTYATSTAAISTANPPILAGYYGSFGIPSSSDTFWPYNNSKTAVGVTSCQSPGFGQTFIPFCGVQHLKINAFIAPFSVALGASNNPLCQACLPGYIPNFIASTNIISSCTVISNCNFNVAKKFNLCDQCNSNFALIYDTSAPDQLSFYQACIAVANRDLNCIYANQATGACVICKPGYFLNADSMCDALNAWDCQVPGFLSPLSLKPYRTLAVYGTGCQQCSDSSILIRFTSQFAMCAMSVLFASNTPVTNSKFLIPNCQSFGLNPTGSIVCFECMTGYLPTVANSGCFPVTSALANCLVVTNDGSTCYSCTNNYYALNGRCVVGTNQNCQAYVPGQPNSCLTCVTGYIAVSISTSMSICVKNPDINCATFNSHSSVMGQISCNQCQAGYFYETRTNVLGVNPLPICVAIPSVPNCVRYQNTGTILTANMNCLQCSAKYYVASAGCVLRTNAIIPNCSALDPAADACQTCVTGYWLDAAKTCQPFPTGISGCIIYKSAVSCAGCDVKMYLNSNKCLPIPAANLISNCLYYDSNMNCQACATGYFLQGLTSCVTVQATNCNTYVDVSHCATCLPNYGMAKSATTTNCVAISIPNCLTPDNSTLSPNFKCLVCQTSFYLNANGGCTAVPSNIPYCYLYSSATTCSTCFTGYVLSPLNTSCVINTYLRGVMDPNCQFAVLLNNPVCNACRPGYTMQSNPNGTVSCVQCDPSNPFCLVCDPKNTSSCLACAAGYTQSASGACNKTFQSVKALATAGRTLLTALTSIIWVVANHH